MRNTIIKLSFLAAVVGSMVSCSSQPPELIEVRHFHLQSVDLVDDEAGMARGEQLYRLRGAVTLEERKNRLGHYYTVDWESSLDGAGDLKLVMDYQQSATASKVLRMTRELPDNEQSGKAEFIIAGENYRVGGQVLAWRVQLIRGKTVISEKRSYLWK